MPSPRLRDWLRTHRIQPEQVSTAAGRSLDWALQLLAARKERPGDPERSDYTGLPSRSKLPTKAECAELDRALALPRGTFWRGEPGGRWRGVAAETLHDLDRDLWRWHLDEVKRARETARLQLTEDEVRMVEAVRALGEVGLAAALARVLRVLAPMAVEVLEVLDTASRWSPDYFRRAFGQVFLAAVTLRQYEPDAPKAEPTVIDDSIPDYRHAEPAPGRDPDPSGRVRTAGGLPATAPPDTAWSCPPPRPADAGPDWPADPHAERAARRAVNRWLRAHPLATVAELEEQFPQVPSWTLRALRAKR